MKLLLNWEVWLYGLVSGFIGGGATAVCSGLGITGATAAGVEGLPQVSLKLLGVIFVSGGVASACGYLMKSPLPQIRAKSTSSEKE